VGPKSYLTHAEEKQLVKYLVSWFKMSYGKTSCEVLKLVDAVVISKD